MLKKLLEKHGRLYSEQLGISLRTPDGVFKWFFASVLFGVPIQESCAIKTFRVFEKAHMIDAQRIANARWDRLVRLLDEGSYTRYDFKTADKLLEVTKNLVARYDGDLNKLYKQAKSQEDLERSIKTLGKGVGDTTVSIFLRDMQGVWRGVRAKPTRLELLAARKLGIRDVHDYWEKHKIRGFTPANFQTALARLGKQLRH